MQYTTKEKTGRILLRHVSLSLRILAEQLLARAAALLPVWLPWVLPQLSGKLPFSPLYLRAAIVLLLYALLVYPMRSRAALQLTKLVRRRDSRGLALSAYPQLVLAGLFRMLGGALWGLPLALLSVRLYQYIFVFDITRFRKDFCTIGAFLSAASSQDSQTYIGMTVFFGALLLSALLLLYGWWRGVPFDFQMVGAITARQARKLARRVRPACRGTLLRIMPLHMLLCVAAFAASFLTVYLKLRPLLVGDPMEDIRLTYVFLQSGVVSGGTLFLAGGIFMLLYLPFLLYRKAGNASAVVNCYAEKRR